MKIKISGTTERANKSIVAWAVNPKNASGKGFVMYLEQEWPPVMVEVYKNTGLDWFLKQMAKRLKIPVEMITKDQIKQETVKNKLKKKASRKLKIPKEELILEVEE